MSRSRQEKSSDAAAASEPGAMPRDKSVPPVPLLRDYPSLLVCVLLVLSVWVIYAQTLHEGFVNYDDNRCVYDNPAIAQGLSWAGVHWAFTHTLNDNWLPLTALSHMLDCQLYRLQPEGHHRTNVLLHAANAVLLFLLLRALTAAVWRSAFVAAVFALHPLHVESVAWVSERKDVLSGLFFMLTLWAYVRYAELSKVRSQKSKVAYGLAILCFVLGLLSKPMLVTVPFVLLLLDYWPLGRWTAFAGQASGARLSRSPSPQPSPQGKGEAETAAAKVAARRKAESRATILPLPKGPQRAERESYIGILTSGGLGKPLGRGEGKGTARTSAINSSTRTLPQLIREKIPFLLLSAADCVATLVAQRDAMWSGGDVAFPARIANALAAYGAYLGQTLYPVGLAVFYPHPGKNLSMGMVGLSALLLILISAGVVAGRRKHPYLLTGWLWYLGMLAPVIGIIQVGGQSRADRYTYLPQIGLCLMAAWGVAELCGRNAPRRAVGSLAGAAALGFFLMGAYAQTAYWKDSVSLWTRALACAPESPFVQNNLGAALVEQGKLTEAAEHYERALQLNPNYAEAQNNLGFDLALQGKPGEALPHYQSALRLKPAFPEALFNSGNALAGQGRPAEAGQYFLRAIQLKPDYVGARYNLGNVFSDLGHLPEAVANYQRVLELRPDFPDAHNNLGNALARQGNLAEAVKHYERALQLNPNLIDAHNNLGNALTRQGKFAEAIAHYDRVSQLKPDSIEAPYNAALAFAAGGKFPEAIQRLQQALTLATAQNRTALAETIRDKIKTYQSASPQNQTP